MSQNNKTLLERIGELEAELERRGGTVGYPMELSPELKLSVLEQFIAADDAYRYRATAAGSARTALEARIGLPPDLRLSDEEVAAKIRAIAEYLASYHVALEFTNHLDDREFYRVLLDVVLDDPELLLATTPGTIIHYDISMPYEDDLGDPGALIGDSLPIKSDRDQWLSTLAEPYRFVPPPLDGN